MEKNLLHLTLFEAKPNPRPLASTAITRGFEKVAFPKIVRELQDKGLIVRQKSLLACRQLLSAPLSQAQCISGGIAGALVSRLSDEDDVCRQRAASALQLLVTKDAGIRSLVQCGGTAELVTGLADLSRPVRDSCYDTLIEACRFNAMRQDLVAQGSALARLFALAIIETHEALNHGKGDIAAAVVSRNAGRGLEGPGKVESEEAVTAAAAIAADRGLPGEAGEGYLERVRLDYEKLTVAAMTPEAALRRATKGLTVLVACTQVIHNEEALEQLMRVPDIMESLRDLLTLRLRRLVQNSKDRRKGGAASDDEDAPRALGKKQKGSGSRAAETEADAEAGGSEEEGGGQDSAVVDESTAAAAEKRRPSSSSAAAAEKESTKTSEGGGSMRQSLEDAAAEGNGGDPTDEAEEAAANPASSAGGSPNENPSAETDTGREHPGNPTADVAVAASSRQSKLAPKEEKDSDEESSDAFEDGTAEEGWTSDWVLREEAQIREFAAALLSCLAVHDDMKLKAVQAGCVPCLVNLLAMNRRRHMIRATANALASITVLREGKYALLQTEVIGFKTPPLTPGLEVPQPFNERLDPGGGGPKPVDPASAVPGDQFDSVALTAEYLQLHRGGLEVLVDILLASRWHEGLQEDTYVSLTNVLTNVLEAPEAREVLMRLGLEQRLEDVLANKSVQDPLRLGTAQALRQLLFRTRPFELLREKELRPELCDPTAPGGLDEQAVKKLWAAQHPELAEP